MKDVRTIRSIDWTHKLGTFGDIAENLEDIHQCLRVILSTPKGTDPLRPEFAMNIFDLIDRPMNEVVAELVSGAVESVRIWEPRVQVTNVKVEFPDLGHVHFTLTWTLKVGGANYVTEVTV